MSAYLFNQENEPDESDSITLYDEAGRPLDCYVENSLEQEDAQYLLLMPVDIPVVIIAWEEDDDETEDAEAILLEDQEEISGIFADAKAVLAELDLSLKYTAYTLTVSGELPPIEDEDILTLEIEGNDPAGEMEEEELQFLASFYHEEERYSIYTPLAPLLFLAKAISETQIELVHPDNDELKHILEELLFEDAD
ncbi:sll1109 [Synechocystis sp. PCC 6803]|uniref:Sll1109 protein n=1 Tax=Synechocystis sp. (strain ATCC 27184 / PCC 6803 / Kazusa) TaxID=1111708 RepID=P74708_SYNY3|nr:MULTISPECIES: DUF3727 domain-containing protein [unclassified Synechocystis]WLT39624.1 DUF3727 domain-containing protein [Synechocystis sp. B12]BAM53298.1 hypothetical protein BEST7613_4367 [Synechocystis sp. PCC 6803] [Bacillus subtilis BEST7613]AGF53376.1 hypothetical protein MYO_131570 [Synechocystis sp. PCC 6803]ALJ69246.1 hypothetical protein AOY38_16230 [Synechocystis sp. PCC 6803]AVP91109.1 DUF3727 domain-containing protein [Synechocystis sp. IPPAS B-1465]